MSEDERYRTIHIVSDGTPFNTKITDETGAMVKNVHALNIDMEVGKGLAEITLQINASAFDVDGAVTEVQFDCPLCPVVIDHDCRTGLVKRRTT